jgi:hypothetical protein
MKRREFFKTAAICGAAGTLPAAFTRNNLKLWGKTP